MVELARQRRVNHDVCEFNLQFLDDGSVRGNGVDDVGACDSFRGHKRWDKARWVKGSLVYTLLYWGLFPILSPKP